MKREIRELLTVDGQQVLRVTTPDERFYARQISADGTEENKRWDYVPSATWIAGHYPMGVGFYKWLATKGWSEAEEIKARCGDKGSKVHQAIAFLAGGGTISLEHSEFENPRTLEPESLSAEEYFCVMTFVEWFIEVKPEIIASEVTVYSEKYRYAGTLDLYLKINGLPWIIDIKTSQDVWPSHELQLSAYKHADASFAKGTRLAVLQVGYKRNKKQKFKFTPVADQFDLFLAARKIWAKECAGITVHQRDYPLEIKLP